MKNVTLIVVIALILLLGGCGCSGYNKLVTQDQNVKGKWGNVQSEYQRRLELIPNTYVCGGCARLFNVGKKKKGHMIFGHKTGAEIQVLSAETFESQKKYWTPNGARSAVKNFSKHICS